ncbi:MAG: two-component regulator propeller domain-containing protein [Vicinamibacterales bacterium]
MHGWLARTAALLLWLVAGEAAGVHAAALDGVSNYTVTTWTRRDGMVASPIWAIAQDQQGYLWLGTGAGPVRFDGVRFVRWESAGQNAFPRGTVLSILSSRDGSLWFGFSGTGIARLRNGALTLYDEPAGLSFIRTFVEDGDGRIWAGGRGGLFRFTGQTWEREGVEAGLPDGPNSGALLDTDGSMWVESDKAIYRRPRDARRFERTAATPQRFARLQTFRAELSLGSAGPGANLFRAVEDRRGNVWIPTLDQGLWSARSRPGGQQILEHMTARNGLASDVVGAVFRDRDDNIWIGTQASLHQLTRRKVALVRNVGAPSTIHAEADGSVWIGTDQGLVRIRDGARRTYTEQDGLPSRVVYAITSDPHGDLWVATENGLARFANERIATIQLREAATFGRVSALAVDDQGALWINDLHHGVLRLYDGTLTTPAHAETRRQTAYALFRARDGRVWIGFSGGRVGALGRDGSLSMHDQIGLTGGVTGITEDADGTLWLSAADGVARLRDGKASAVTRRANGLPDADVISLATESGAVWAGTRTGLLRIERAEFDRVERTPSHQVQYKLYDDADGLEGMPTQMGFPSVTRATDNALWFLTEGGATVVNPNALSQTSLPPRVYIEEVLAGGQSLAATDGLTVPAHGSRLEIGYNAPTFSSPQSLRFRYRLDGFDTEWQDAGTRRQAVYTNLPPGAFRFQVMAIDKEGRAEAASPIAFRILPAFYQTTWFLAACVVAVAGLGAAAWRFRIRQVQRRFNLVLAERVRISREIHDTLLQSLVAVALQSGTIAEQAGTADRGGIREQLMRLRRDVEGQIREVRESIWDLRSPNGPPDLVSALRLAGERAARGTALIVDVVVTGQPRPCAASTERELLRIGQEALTNSAHHAQATRVVVELAYEADSLRLTVTDDGIGFDPDVSGLVTGKHLGLVNIRERAHQVGGHAVVTSSRGQGTQIVATLPLPTALSA